MSINNDDPFGINWATDPINGDPHYQYNWQASGNLFGTYGLNGDLNTLWSMIEGMKQTGAFDNLPDIIAFFITMGKSSDASNTGLQQFFAQYGSAIGAQLVNAELLLSYSQNLGTPPNPSNAEAAMKALANSLLNGPLSGVSTSDPILGSMVSQLQTDITPKALEALRQKFWTQDPTTGVWTFAIPPGEGGSQDGQPIDCTGAGGSEIFAEYVFGQVFYYNTFGQGGIGDATDGLGKLMFDEMVKGSKNSDYLFIAIVVMFMMLGDDDSQNQLQGYGYVQNTTTNSFINPLQTLINQWNQKDFFTNADGTPTIDPKTNVSNAQEWMTSLRRLMIDSGFNPFSSTLSSSFASAVKSIFGTTNPTDPTTGSLTIGGEYFDLLKGTTTDPSLLATGLNDLANGTTTAATPPVTIAPDTTIVDSLQTLAKSATDRSQSIQTEMSAVSNNDNTIVNTAQASLKNITTLETQVNSHMTSN